MHDVWHSNLNYVSSSEVTDLGDVRLVKETVDQKDQTQILMHEHQHGLMQSQKLSNKLFFTESNT